MIASGGKHRGILQEVLAAENEKGRFWVHLTSLPDVGEDSLFERDRSLPVRATDQGLFADN